MKSIRLGSHVLGQENRICIVVEVGTTCNGDVETALRMVDASKEAGADAIKFQMIDPDHFMSDKKVTYEYTWAKGQKAENMYEMFLKLRFSETQWLKIREYCAKKDIAFYATVDHLPGVEVAEKIGMEAFKLSSWDANNLPLARAMARTGKPIELDLGPASLSDIDKLVQTIRQEGNDQIILMHCSHAMNDGEVNLRTIPYLKKVYGLPLGYSADSRDPLPDYVALGLGACLLEKRLTLDKDYPGHHHVKALEPQEFKEYVCTIRRIEKLLGKDAVIPSAEDLVQKQLYFVSVVANKRIEEGETITREKLSCKRPGNGISPEWLDLFIGQKAKQSLEENEQLTWDMI